MGGLERVVISLVAGSDRARYRPVLVCLQAGGGLLSEIAHSGAPVHALCKGDRFSARALAALAGILRRERADIVHCHNHGALSYGVLAALLAGRGRVVYTAHGVLSARRLGESLLGLGRRRVRRAVAVSDDVRRVMTERGGMDPSRTDLIINGIDARRFAAAGDAAATRAALGLAPAVFLLGIVARLTPVKDHANLLGAFASVRERYRDAHLLIVGGGESEDAVRSRVQELGLSACVTLAGDRRDVPALLGAMDAFVLSSRSEGLSITLLEAMAASLPVVATRVGGNPEIVVDGVTGLLVEAGNPGALAGAVGFLIEHRAAARAMGAAGRSRVEAHFSERAMVAQYQRVYERVLGG